MQTARPNKQLVSKKLILWILSIVNLILVYKYWLLIARDCHGSTCKALVHLIEIKLEHHE
jgi:hypothetical protein